MQSRDCIKGTPVFAFLVQTYVSTDTYDFKTTYSLIIFSLLQYVPHKNKICTHTVTKLYEETLQNKRKIEIMRPYVLLKKKKHTFQEMKKKKL